MVDDSLKALFEARGILDGGMLDTGTNFKFYKQMAMVAIEVQAQDRLVRIAAMAKEACQSSHAEIEEKQEAIKRDLLELGDVLDKEGAEKFRQEVMKIDKKYALPEYREFCKCNR